MGIDDVIAGMGSKTSCTVDVEEEVVGARTLT